MAIDVTTLATRLGKLVGGLNELNTYRQTTLGTRYDTIDNQYEATDQQLMDGLYSNRDLVRSSLDSATFYWSDLAKATVQQMVEDDRPGLGGSFGGALNEWYRQLVLGGYYFAKSTTTSTVSTTLVPPRGKMTVSSPGDLCYPDTILAEVTQDASTGTSPYSEIVTLTGTGTALPLGGTWPDGSGTSAAITVLDPALSYGIPNGSFLEWDADDDTPTSWTLASGTDPTRTTTTATGVRGENGPYPTFPVAVGTHRIENTTVTLRPNTYYSWCVFLKYAGTGTTGDRINIKVAGGVVLDADVTSYSTSAWTQVVGIVKTGSQTYGIPAMSIEVNSVGSNQAVSVAYTGVTQLTPLTQLGSYVAVWSGASPFYTGDKWTITTVLDSGTMTGSLVRGIDRLVGTRDFGIELPTAGATVVGTPMGLLLTLTYADTSTDFSDALVS